MLPYLLCRGVSPLLVRAPRTLLRASVRGFAAYKDVFQDAKAAKSSNSSSQPDSSSSSTSSSLSSSSSSSVPSSSSSSSDSDSFDFPSSLPASVSADVLPWQRIEGDFNMDLEPDQQLDELDDVLEPPKPSGTLALESVGLDVSERVSFSNDARAIEPLIMSVMGNIPKNETEEEKIKNAEKFSELFVQKLKAGAIPRDILYRPYGRSLASGEAPAKPKADAPAMVKSEKDEKVPFKRRKNPYTLPAPPAAPVPPADLSASELDSLLDGDFAARKPLWELSRPERERMEYIHDHMSHHYYGTDPQPKWSWMAHHRLKEFSSADWSDSDFLRVMQLGEAGEEGGIGMKQKESGDMKLSGEELKEAQQPAYQAELDKWNNLQNDAIDKALAAPYASTELIEDIHEHYERKLHDINMKYLDSYHRKYFLEKMMMAVRRLTMLEVPFWPRSMNVLDIVEDEEYLDELEHEQEEALAPELAATDVDLEADGDYEPDDDINEMLASEDAEEVEAGRQFARDKAITMLEDKEGFDPEKEMYDKLMNEKEYLEMMQSSPIGPSGYSDPFRERYGDILPPAAFDDDPIVEESPQFQFIDAETEMPTQGGHEIEIEELPTYFKGKLIKTWQRSEADYQITGAHPNYNEAVAFMKETLGVPRPADLPINPPKATLQRQEHPVQEESIRSEKEWRRFTKGKTHRTFLNASRPLFRRQLGLYRKSYHAEYMRVRQIHLNNLLMKAVREQEERKKKVEKVLQKRQLAADKQKTFVYRALRLKAKKRIKRRFNRLTKEYKHRKDQLKQISYLLEERKQYWPIKNPRNQNEAPFFDTAMFQREEYVEGFWPIHPEIERTVQLAKKQAERDMFAQRYGKEAVSR